MGDRRSSRCKGTEVRTGLVYLWNSKKAGVVGGHWTERQRPIRGGLVGYSLTVGALESHERALSWDVT